MINIKLLSIDITTDNGLIRTVPNLDCNNNIFTDNVFLRWNAGWLYIPVYRVYFYFIGDVSRASQWSLRMRNSSYFIVACIRVHTLVCVIHVHNSTYSEAEMNGAFWRHRNIAAGWNTSVCLRNTYIFIHFLSVYHYFW